MEFSFLTARKIVFKTGAVADIAQYIAGYGKNFLIVVDPFFKESETMQKVKSLSLIHISAWMESGTICGCLGRPIWKIRV